MSAAQMLLALTGAATLAAGALLYGDGDATLATLAPGTNGQYLKMVAGAPAWDTLTYGDITSGTVGVANGGTGLASYTIGDLLYADGATSLAKLAAVATGSVLASAGVGTAPAWASSIALTGTIASKQASAAGISLDHNSATGNFTMRLSPANITANRRATFPDADVVVAGSAAALTSGRVPFATTGGLLLDSSRFTYNDSGGGGITAAHASSSFFISVSGASGFAKGFVFNTGGVSRWIFQCDSTAESGSDAGSPFTLYARTDAGAAIDTPISIVRAAGGTMTLSRPTTFSASTTAITISSTNATAFSLAGGINGATSGRIYYATTNGAPATSASLLWNNAGQVLTVGDGTTAAGAYFLVNAPAGQEKSFLFRTNGSNRWALLQGTGAESGANAGSPFQWVAYSDAGSVIDVPVTITRAALGSVAIVRPTSVAIGTITTDIKVLDSSATWNNSGVTFTGWKLNVTDTASAAGSILLDLQVGGSSRFVVKANTGVQAVARNASTSAGVNVVTFDATSTGTPAAGFGSTLLMRADSSTNTLRNVLLLSSVWATATDASRVGRAIFEIYDTSAREAIRLDTDGSGAQISLFGAGSYGGGRGVVFIANAGVVPSSNPSGGGILYTEAGALKYRGSSGTITTLGVA